MAEHQSAFKDIIFFSSKNEKISLINMYAEINFYEDIFSNFLSGNISIIDTIGMLPTFEMIGYESIKFSFNNGLDEKDFYIYSVTDRKQINETSNYYVLNFISYEAINDSRGIVTNYLTGSYSSMANDIFNTLESEKDFTYTDDKTTTSFICPHWKVSRILNTFANKAISTSDKCDYFFWETLSDGFYFCSLSDLRDDQDGEYKKYNYHILNTEGGNPEPGNIREFELITSFDSLRNSQQGGVASTELYLDINKKLVKRTDFSYNEYVKNLSYIPKGTDILNKVPSESYFSYPIIGYENSGLFGDLNKNYLNPEQWQQRRLAELSNLNNVVCRLTLFGDLNLKAGDTIIVNIPKGAISSKTNNPIDNVISGKFYITSLRNFINKNLHYTSVEICKAQPDEALKNIG